MLFRFLAHLYRPISIAPLVTFRVLFGIMMFLGTLRFWMKGWITDLYVTPKFHFTYMGFEWVHPFNTTGMHLVFGLMLLSTVFISLGFLYRAAILTFFVLFSYVELIDVTNYLNHYYFISLVAFLMIWLPSNRYLALDVYFNPEIKRTQVPLWTVGIVRLQIALVYFFAGLAKLNFDWLIEAMPMKIWLPAKSYLPVVGHFLFEPWVAYLFSWFGAVYDLLIAFFLISGKTRPFAYLFVVGFHVSTAIFFPEIGMFPYIMIVGSLIFLSSAFHQKILDWFSKSQQMKIATANQSYSWHAWPGNYLISLLLSIYFLLQLVIPMRYLFYPGKLFWVEEGYRFSWRVMLMEKSGIAFFYVKEPATGRTYEVNNKEYLTSLQEKMMSTQPDLILQYARYLKKEYQKKGIDDPAIFAKCYVTLNGQRSRPFVDTAVDLSRQQVSFKHYNWVLPYAVHEK